MSSSLLISLFSNPALFKRMKWSCKVSSSLRKGFEIGKKLMTRAWRRESLPTPVYWPGQFHGLYGVAKSWTGLSDWLSLSPVLLPGKSHGWRSLVGCSHEVHKSWTRLSDFTFTFHFHALEKEMATRSSVLAWRIPRTGKPGGLPSIRSHRVGYDWSDLAAVAGLEKKASNHELLEC